MDNRFEVTVGAGTMMSGSDVAVRFPHRWTRLTHLLSARFPLVLGDPAWWGAAAR